MCHRNAARCTMLGWLLGAVGLLLAPGMAAEPSEERVPADKWPEVLRFLASRNEANYRKIQTWQGTYRFVDRYQPPPRDLSTPPADAVSKKAEPRKPEVEDVIVVRQGTVKFALDVEGDRLWVNYREDLSKTVFTTLDGKRTFKPGKYYFPVERTAIVTADSIIDMFPNAALGPVRDFPDDPYHVTGGGSKLAERREHPPGMRRVESNEIIDPRHFFVISGLPAWDLLTLHARSAEGTSGPEVAAQMRRDCTIVKRETPRAAEYVIASLARNSAKPSDVAKFVTRFSEAVGYLPVEYTVYRPPEHVNVHKVWGYTSADGILVPRELHFRHCNKRGEETKLVLDRQLVLVEAKLNQALPEGIFSTEGGLQLARGDRFVDRIEQRLWVHDGSGLVAARDYNPATGQQRVWGRAYVVWGGVAVLAVLGGWLAWRRVGRKRGREGA